METDELLGVYCDVERSTCFVLAAVFRSSCHFQKDLMTSKTILQSLAYKAEPSVAGISVAVP